MAGGVATMIASPRAAIVACLKTFWFDPGSREWRSAKSWRERNPSPSGAAHESHTGQHVRDQDRGGGAGGRLTQSGGFSRSRRTYRNGDQESFAIGRISPANLKHFRMQNASGHFN